MGTRSRFGEQRLVTSQIHRDIRPVKPPHRATHDVPRPILELRVNQLLFRPPDVLHERLFGVLRRDSAEVCRRDFDLNLAAQLRLGVDPPGVENGDLIVFGHHFLRDHHSFAKALISPLLGSMVQRNSRAGPTAFFAANSNASSTAFKRTSFWMPFSRSQYSNTAKNSAFIVPIVPYKGTKKSVEYFPDFLALVPQQ